MGKIKKILIKMVKEIKEVKAKITRKKMQERVQAINKRMEKIQAKISQIRIKAMGISRIKKTMRNY